MKYHDIGFDDDLLVIGEDPDVVKEKMAEQIKIVHKDEFEDMSDFHQEEIMSKIDLLLRSGCGFRVLKL